jgi:hypothetical protein
MSADADLLLRDARAAYLAANGLPADGGYEDAWVRFKIGPLPVAFPNTEGRRRAVPLHDLHHPLTGYGTDLVGEAEIGGWELGSGCTRYPAALVLNLLASGFVLPGHPRRVLRALLRGRQSRNLYATAWDDALLGRRVGEVRAELGLDGDRPPAASRDRIAVAGWAAAAVGVVWGPLALAAWWLLG